MRFERLDQVGDHRADASRVEIGRLRELHLVGFGAVGNVGRASALPPGSSATSLADHGLDLEGVGPVGQVEVVGFGGPRGNTATS